MSAAAYLTSTRRAELEEEEEYDSSADESDDCDDWSIHPDAPRGDSVDRVTPWLGFSFSTESDCHQKLDEKPIFDVDKPDLVDKYLHGYHVQRQTTYAPVAQTMGNTTDIQRTASMQRFISSACQQAKNEFPDSSWVVLIHDQDKDDQVILHPQQDRDTPPGYHVLTKILQTGKLHKCHLRGDPETGQLGLVASHAIRPNVAIAVEGGLIWPESIHDEQVVTENPSRGLSSSYVGPELLQCLASRETWDCYQKHHRIQEDGKERVAGIIIECSTHGNETKHIDDPGWLHAGENQPTVEPNVDAHLVLDLERRMPTVAFFTNTHICKGEELVMDWGCWPQISLLYLPGQAFLSLLAYEWKRTLVIQCEKQDIPWKRICDGVSIDHLEPRFLNPKKITEEARTVPDAHRSRGNLWSQKLDLLCSIMGAPALDRTVTTHNKKVKLHPMVEIVNDFDYKSVRARMAALPLFDPSHHKLSSNARKAIRDCARRMQSQVCRRVKALYAMKDFSQNVKVVKITDPKHPACLFSLPTHDTYGVVANKQFKRGDAVLFYGGEIRDYEEQDMQFDSFLFDLDLSAFGYDGPQLFIHGNQSIGGRINDPRSIGDTMTLKANIEAFVDWHNPSRTPQIVFAALRTIKEGDELFYDYGNSYWKVMWNAIMMTHAEYCTRTQEECKALKKEIQDKLRRR